MTKCRSSSVSLSFHYHSLIWRQKRRAVSKAAPTSAHAVCVCDVIDITDVTAPQSFDTLFLARPAAVSDGHTCDATASCSACLLPPLPPPPPPHFPSCDHLNWLPAVSLVLLIYCHRHHPLPPRRCYSGRRWVVDGRWEWGGVGGGGGGAVDLFVSLPECLSCRYQSSGGVWKSRWTSWAPVPNKPTVSVDVKQHFNNICLYVSQSVCLSLCAFL